MLKFIVLRTALIAFACSLSVAAYAYADPRPINVPAGDLTAALESLAKQSGVELVYQPDQLKGFRTRGVSGTLEPRDAVSKLLEGTPLRLHTDASGAMLISAPPPTGGSAVSPVRDQKKSSEQKLTDDASSVSSQQLLAQATTPTPASGNHTSLQSKDDENGTPRLADILVTAQKRSERLQDVPVPVTAISGDALASNDQLRIQDYALTVPGLSVSGQSGNYREVTIRGITTNGGNPTVGIMIDDVPFGSQSIDGGGLFVPDIDPGDLARVEVLRGPQGTLYGASSMGGLLKYVTVDPSTERYSARIQAGTEDVYNGAQLGYNLRGSLNSPITDTLAIRVSGFTRTDPGYIDDPTLHVDGVNKSETYGAHVSALWKPSEDFSLKVSALYQNDDFFGDYNVNSILPDLQQNEVRGAGRSDMKIQVYSATVNAKLGSGDLTAVTGYNVNDTYNSQDYASFDPYTLAQFNVAGTLFTQQARNSKFTQEVRYAMSLGSRVDWLIAGFYSHETTSWVQNLYAADPASGAIAGTWVVFTVPQTYEEYSAFTDLTFHVTDRFDIQIGGRDSEIRQSSLETQTGAPYAALVGSQNPDNYPLVKSRNNAATYLVTPQFKFSPDLMAYARLASGYRPGGPNVAPGVPPQYAPDKTLNYEIGLKGNVFNHSLTIDSSVYYIDWKDIQLSLLDLQNYQGYTTNASRAKSEGLELSVSATPVPSLTLSAWAAWDTAVLTSGFPQSSLVSSPYGVAGDRLPYGSRFSGSVSAQQEFPLWARATGFVGVTVSYVGDQIGSFQSIVTPGVAPPRQSFAGYARSDLRAGAKYDSWTVNVFANNLADKRAAVTGGLDGYPPTVFTYIQPRTIGLNIIRAF